VASTRLEAVQPLFEAAFREYGMPQRIRTDNGAPFGSVGLLGLSRLAVWWMRLGIEPERIEPGRPDQNGRHERMHRTLKEAMKCKTGPSLNVRQAHRWLLEFQREYNEDRPHEALGNHPPAREYCSSVRSYPARLPPVEYASEAQVRKVSGCGAIQWHNNAIFLSEVLTGQWVAMEWCDEQTMNIKFMNVHLAQYDTLKGTIRYVDGRKGARSQRSERPGRTMKMKNV